jgi:hypothetical protein
MALVLRTTDSGAMAHREAELRSRRKTISAERILRLSAPEAKKISVDSRKKSTKLPTSTERFYVSQDSQKSWIVTIWSTPAFSFLNPIKIKEPMRSIYEKDYCRFGPNGTFILPR